MTILSARGVGAVALLTACCALAGCAGQTASTATLPGIGSIQSNGLHAKSVPSAASIGAHSRIDPAAAKGRLLYVADPFDNEVLVYTYPALTGAGVISGFTSVDGLCTDRRGYLWVLDTSGIAVWEFRHGGTRPINFLEPSSPSGNPGVGTGCAVNPKTGDLAVVGAAGSGRLTVFRNGQNSQTTLSDFNYFQLSYVGYDNAGNLFVDGDLQSSFAFGLDEAVAGSSTLQSVALSGGSPLRPGGIQWDGSNLDIADSSSGTIYQTNGSAVVGTVSTAASCQGQFYITGNHDRLIVPDDCSISIGVYKYPSGGTPIKTLTGGLQLPTSVAISVPGF